MALADRFLRLVTFKSESRLIYQRALRGGELPPNGFLIWLMEFSAEEVKARLLCRYEL